MRRTNFLTDNNQVICELLNESEVGQLGIITDDGYPRVVPVNFVAEGTTVFFHGADEGEKFSVLIRNPKVTFSVSKPYSIIPSYWLAKDYACPATALYKSVQINGMIRIIDDLLEKARVLNLLMDKLQPEGGYKTIDPSEKMYAAALSKVQVFRIETEHFSAKSKFAQNKPESVRRELIVRLEQRNQGMDRVTAGEIAKTLSDHAWQ
ncbi:MAG: pyridoxamine 5'-phosphate oxidase family protein [Candidatus Zixiibacteriota bacterium]